MEIDFWESKEQRRLDVCRVGWTFFKILIMAAFIIDFIRKIVVQKGSDIMIKRIAVVLCAIAFGLIWMFNGAMFAWHLSGGDRPEKIINPPQADKSLGTALPHRQVESEDAPRRSEGEMSRYLAAEPPSSAFLRKESNR